MPNFAARSARHLSNYISETRGLERNESSRSIASVGPASPQRRSAASQEQDSALRAGREGKKIRSKRSPSAARSLIKLSRESSERFAFGKNRSISLDVETRARVSRRCTSAKNGMSIYGRCWCKRNFAETPMRDRFRPGSGLVRLSGVMFGMVNIGMVVQRFEMSNDFRRYP